MVFANTVDSRSAAARRLEINTAGVTRFGNETAATEGLGSVGSGRVGGNFALLSVLTDSVTAAAGSRGGAAMFDIAGAGTGTPTVRTTGFQIYNEAVQLSLNTVLESTAGGNVVFANTVDSRSAAARSLEINTSGLTRFGNETAATEGLGSVGSGRVGGNFALLSVLTDSVTAAAGSRGGATMFDIAGVGRRHRR